MLFRSACPRTHEPSDRAATLDRRGRSAWTARVAGVLALAPVLLGGCSTAPASRESAHELVRQAEVALGEWNGYIPGLEGFARRSYGYAVFPEIAKGGLGIGAAYGRGVVFERDAHLGYADLSQVSLGFQVGGQVYQALVVFADAAALEQFTRGTVEFSADASGVVVTAGYAVTVRLNEGITVFARPTGGVMGEASVGGARFTFVPKDEADRRLRDPQ
jgi:hypothetical protein